MSEFNNRINAQRAALKIINSNNGHAEDLFGLSKKAIDRWVSNNKIPRNEYIVDLVLGLSEKLFFLSNKSQEQITEEYQSLSKAVSDLINAIELEITKKMG